ncbi:MAG: T9SS type A sorting domain-containing protein [Bacteroidales bacterium]|nr:T9SS type A sorting domain-containing protein [Bacteroidales bacterium]
MVFTHVGVKESVKSGSVVTACYPNPFSTSSQFSVNLDKASKVSVTISTLTGQQVSTTNYGTLGAGINNLTIDGSNLSSGIYFYTVTVGTEKYTNKFIIK